MLPVPAALHAARGTEPTVHDLAFRRSLDAYLTRSPGEDDPRCTLCGDYGRVSAEGVCQSCDEQVRAEQAEAAALAESAEAAYAALEAARAACAKLGIALDRACPADGSGPLGDAAVACGKVLDALDRTGMPRARLALALRRAGAAS